MAQLIAGSLILIASFFLGSALSATYSKRVRFLSDYIDFLAFAESEIGFYKREMDELITNFATGGGGDFRKYLTEKFIAGREIKPADEAGLVEEFVTGMASLDLNSQRGFTALCRQKADRALRDARENATTKGSLVKKLTPLVGAALFIIIV